MLNVYIFLKIYVFTKFEAGDRGFALREGYNLPEK